MWRIWLVADSGSQAWLEGALGLRDISITDNVLVDCGTPAIDIGVHVKNVTNRNNTVK